MTLPFLQPSRSSELRNIERDLKTFYKTDLSRYRRMDTDRLQEHIDRLQKKNHKVVTESRYGSWLRDDTYMRDKMLMDALELIKEAREEQEQHEVLVPEWTYYRGVKQFGDLLVGEACTVLEGHTPNWVPFERNVAVAKAFEVLRGGEPEDFKRIYIEEANGRLNGLEEVSLEHISESSKDALKRIEEYADSRWEGPWPWETQTPIRLNKQIKEAKKMRSQTLQEMQGRFNKALRQLNEQGMEKYEAMNAIHDMVNQVDSMIKDLGKISSSGIEASASARSVLGNSSAQQIEDAMGDPVNQAADALSNLKSTLSQVVSQMDDSGGMGGDDLGGGPDAGPSPDPIEDRPDDDMADELADVNLDGDDGERPMKDM